MDENWKKLLSLIGVSEKQMEEKDTMEFIYDFVEKRGGIENVTREIENERGGPPQPPSRMGGKHCIIHDMISSMEQSEMPKSLRQLNPSDLNASTHPMLHKSQSWHVHLFESYQSKLNLQAVKEHNFVQVGPQSTATTTKKPKA